jgi:hypothetical protein
MQRQHLSLMAVVPAALLFTCAAGAQQAPPQTQQPQPQTQQNAPMQQQTVPTTSAQTMQCASGGNCYDNNTTDRDVNATGNRNTPRNHPKFSSLAGSKGYVSESDVAGHRWLAGHFSQCDSNHNDKLSRAEYRHCRQAYGHGQQ